MDNTGKQGLTVNLLYMGKKEETKLQANIEVTDFGPIKITGNFLFRDMKRGTEDVKGEVYLCGCGKSGNQPYCDDSHKNK